MARKARTITTGPTFDWDRIPDETVIEQTMKGLKERNFNPVLVADRKQALEKLMQMVPPGAGLMSGGSTTLEEIGLVSLLASNRHPWQSWKDRIFAEKDPQAQDALRRASTTAEYFIGSVQAITGSGQVLGTDATGSRQGGYVFGARNVIWVVGANKIVSDLNTAFRRLHEHCVPLEDARMKKTGAPGTIVGKIVIYEREYFPDRIRTILVGEKLGF